MHRLGSKLVRVMSFAVLQDSEPEAQLREKRFEYLRRIVDLFLEAGVTPVHENCMNYGGMSWQHTLELLDKCPGLKLVFDTANPVFNSDRSKPKPWPKSSGRSKRASNAAPCNC
jgi:sugar phosphate isomerase/epimerase